MDKKYLAKIIAKDKQGLQFISAICFEAEIKPTEIKFLRKNKIFLPKLFQHKLSRKKFFRKQKNG